MEKTGISANEIEIKLIEEIFREYKDKLFNKILHRINNRDEALDLLQESFLIFMENAVRLNLLKEPKHYLNKITSHIVWKRQKNHHITFVIDAFDFDTILLKSDAQQSKKINFEKDLEDNELKFLLWSAVNNLPENVKNVISMKVINKMSFREISSHLDISESTAKRYMKKGLSCLKKYLNRIDLNNRTQI